MMCEEGCRITTSCEDITAAISLPIIVEQERHSLHIDDYVDQKRHQHEEIFRNMHDEIEQLNEYIENEATQFIDVAKEEIELIRQELEESTLVDIDSVDQWMSISDKTEKQKLCISKIVDELQMDLKSFEQSKSEDIKKLLIKYKDEAVSLRFTSIADIEQTFADKIKNINLKMLQNFRKYEDMNLKLQVEGQGMIEKCFDILKERRKSLAEENALHLWNKILEKQNKKLLNEAFFNLSQEKFRAREDFYDVANSLAKNLSEFAEGLRLPAKSDSHGEYWENWIETLNARLGTLDSLCKAVEMLLKSAVTSLMENFDNQINMISRTTGKTYQNHLEGSENNLEVLTELESFKNYQAGELAYLQQKWQDTVDVLSEKIKRSKSFILDLTAIWTSHLDRASKLRNDIESSLQASFNTSLKNYKTNDAKLKGLVKSVREAKDETKLNALTETLREKFHGLVIDLEDGYENQLEMMEEVKRKGVEELINAKQSHIYDFLNNRYRKKEWFSEVLSSELNGSEPSEVSEVSDVPEVSESDIKLVSRIEMCNTYMKAVENRALGMYEMLERYVPYCEKTVREETEEWMNMFIQDIVNNYDSQLNEVNESQAKTLKEIQQLRFAEIQIHSRRLTSHVNGAKHEFSELKKWFEEVKTKQIASVNAFNEKVAMALSKDNVKGVKNVLLELEHEWSGLSESLQNSITEGKKLCDDKFTAVKEANVLFKKTAKNFKSGGNYSPEELKTLNKELLQVGKFVTNERKIILKNFDDLAKNISRKYLDSQIELTNKELKDMNFQRDVMDTLSTLRMLLRSEVNNMKSKYKAIEAAISRLAFNERIDTNLLNNVLEMVDRMHEYMVFPKGVLALECTESKQNSVISTSMTIKTQKNKKSVVPKQKLGPLFVHTTDEVSIKEDNFLGRTKGLILSKYDCLLQTIRETNFAKPDAVVKPKPTKGKETNQSLVPDLATQQIKLLKQTLRSYNSECELVWLSNTRELLDQVVNLKNLFQDITELEFNKTHENYLNSLDRLEREYSNKIKVEEDKRDTEREKLRKNLVLPLAHPAHHEKLAGLRVRAKSTCHLQKQDYEQYTSEYKNELQTKHDNYVRKVKVMKEDLSSLQTKLFSDDLCHTLTTSSKGIRNVVPYENEKVAEETENPEQPVYPLSIWSDGDDISEEPGKHRSICLILLPTSSHSSDDSPSEASREELDRFSVNRIAAEKVKESALTVQKLFDQAKTSQITYEQTIVSWMRTLDSNIKEAKLFYKWPCDDV